MADSMIYFGGSVKALDENGKVGGYLVRFSDTGTQMDLYGEYFTSKTYLGSHDGDGVDTIFHHGQPLPIKAKVSAATQKEIDAFRDKVFAPVKTKRDAVGVWAEAVLDLADEYEKAVFGFVKAGKLGWSSGAISHLVKKSAGGEITRWVIGEASLTPTPAEPLNRALPLDSLDSVKFISLDGEDDDPYKATWTTAYINKLPDSAFLLIEDGGEKDDEGKTKPRSLRHFPYKNDAGEVDLPHLRNALARIPQSSLTEDLKAKALAKARGIAKQNGVGTGEKPASKSLAAELSQFIADRIDDGRTRDLIVGQMARAAGLDVKAVEQYLMDDGARPVDAHLKAFARVLGIEFEILKSAGRRNHLQTIKGMFEEALQAQTPSRWELESTYCSIVKKLAAAASAASIAGVTFDLKAKIEEATTEYTDLLQKHALAQIQDWMDAGADDDFYFKAILDAEARIKSFAATDLDTHSQLTVSVLRDIAERFRGNHEGRVKAGRVLSEKNRQRIASLIEQGKAVFADLQSLLDESQPMALDTEKRALILKRLLRKRQSREPIGV